MLHGKSYSTWPVYFTNVHELLPGRSISNEGLGEILLCFLLFHQTSWHASGSTVYLAETFKSQDRSAV
jgi:hypothetical protein